MRPSDCIWITGPEYNLPTLQLPIPVEQQRYDGLAPEHVWIIIQAFYPNHESGHEIFLAQCCSAFIPPRSRVASGSCSSQSLRSRPGAGLSLNFITGLRHKKRIEIVTGTLHRG